MIYFHSTVFELCTEVAQLYDTKDDVLEALVHKLLLEVIFHRMRHVPHTLTHTHKMKTTDQQGLRHRDYTGPLRNLITDAEDLLESKKSEGIQVGGVWRN